MSPSQYEEHQAKQEAMKRQAQLVDRINQTGSCQMANESKPLRPGLRERIENQIDRSERESEKLGRLRELKNLLFEHPDVARILELHEELSGLY